MNRKWAPYILIGLLIAAIIVLQWRKTREDGPGKKTTTSQKDPATAVNRNRGFDRRTSFLQYSEHAKCRMQCRKISQKEVEEIMGEGKINYNKSDLQHGQCPRYAVEGITSDAQRVRIVFAQCDKKTVVVTAIDLESDFTCHCPGDDEKYKNKK